MSSHRNMDIQMREAAVSSAWMDGVVYQIWWRATVIHVVKKGLSCSLWWLPDSLLAGTRSRGRDGDQMASYLLYPLWRTKNAERQVLPNIKVKPTWILYVITSYLTLPTPTNTSKLSKFW